MYALVKDNPPETLVKYLNQPKIQSISFDNARKMYISEGTHYGGLLSKLKSMYYPYWVRKKKQYKRRGAKPVTRKASSASEGKTIDRQITEYVKSGKTPRNNMAKAIVAYFKKSNQRIVAAQVPLFAIFGTRITQADFIVQDKDSGKLIMIELKCGYNRTQKQGFLKGLPGVPCRQNEIWELQRHYTHRGLEESGLELIGSHVLNVYKEGDGVTVKRRKVPEWALQKLK